MVGVGAGVVGVGAVGVGAAVAGAVGVGAGVAGAVGVVAAGVGVSSATTAAGAAFEDSGGADGVETGEDETVTALLPETGRAEASVDDALGITGTGDVAVGSTVAAEGMAGTPVPGEALPATSPSATAVPADETRTSVVAAMATQVETRMRPLPERMTTSAFADLIVTHRHHGAERVPPNAMAFRRIDIT